MICSFLSSIPAALCVTIRFPAPIQFEFQSKQNENNDENCERKGSPAVRPRWSRKSADNTGSYDHCFCGGTEVRVAADPDGNYFLI